MAIETQKLIDADAAKKSRLVFYCSECGKRSSTFEAVVARGEDCPAIKGCKMGHNVRTMTR